MILKSILRKAFSFFALSVLLFNTALAEEVTQQSLLEKAKQLKLSEQSQWWDLVHYQNFYFPPTFKSLVDDPRFFVSPQGKEDPQSELEASIVGLFASPELGDQHIRCRFPARTAWLQKQLEVTDAQLPKVACERFEAWFKALDPGSLTLIFPSAYPNNPSSAFGHTLIRIDQKSTTALLSYTANFSADANDPNALVYAAKGIFGGYSGFFANAPYFEKVQQYGDLESRDIWEYRLNLTEEEVAQGVRHVWEMREMAFDYFYFDENCSYQLLSILDVAKPGVDLLRKFSLWVIPVDTVRVVTEVPGLIGNVEFRPSTVRVLKNKLDAAELNEIVLAKSLALGEIQSDDAALLKLSAEKQAFVVDLAYDYLQYLLIARKKDTEEVRASMYHFLRARSQIDADLPEQIIATPSVRPEQGHKTSRLRMSYGAALGGEQFGEMEFRPAYHDLLDPSGGYTEGAGIEFFSIKGRFAESRGVELESLTPLSILSITPWNRLTQPTSWMVDLTAQKKNFENDERHTVYLGKTGFGFAYQLASEAMWYGMAQGEVGGNHEFKDNYALGAGGRTGVILFPARDFSMSTTAEAVNFFAGEEHNEFHFVGEGRYSVSPNAALRVGVEYFQEVQDKDTEWKVSMDWYF